MHHLPNRTAGYSPNVVEEEFCKVELPIYRILRTSLFENSSGIHYQLL